MNWPTLPIYTDAEAIDYAEGCAQRWVDAVRLWERVAPAQIPQTALDARELPDMICVPGPYWKTVRDVFQRLTGIQVDEALGQWMVWHRAWYEAQLTWIERVEDTLTDYDQQCIEEEEMRRHMTEEDAP